MRALLSIVKSYLSSLKNEKHQIVNNQQSNCIIFELKSMKQTRFRQLCIIRLFSDTAVTKETINLQIYHLWYNAPWSSSLDT